MIRTKKTKKQEAEIFLTHKSIKGYEGLEKEALEWMVKEKTARGRLSAQWQKDIKVSKMGKSQEMGVFGQLSEMSTPG